MIALSSPPGQSNLLKTLFSYSWWWKVFLEWILLTFNSINFSESIKIFNFLQLEPSLTFSQTQQVICFYISSSQANDPKFLTKSIDSAASKIAAQGRTNVIFLPPVTLI